MTLPAFGLLADRYGRRTVYAFGLVTTAMWAFPAFTLIGTGSTALTYLAVIVAITVGHAAQYAPAAAFFAEMFRTRHRCTGASLGYQLGAAVGGGLSPLLANSLVAGAGDAPWPAAALVGAALVSLACVAATRETRDAGLTDDVIDGVASRRC